MPSQSFQFFRDKNIQDVQRILDTHSAMSGRGRNALDHLTRSAILILAGSWEIYLEDVISESAAFLVNHLHSPRLLPTEVQKKLSSYVKSGKDSHLKPLELAGNGWRDVYLEMVEKEVSAVNTPKSHVINPLFEGLLGANELLNAWGDPKAIDDFVSYRGEIAHRVRSEDYVKVTEVRGYLDLIFEAARLTDNYLSDFTKDTLNHRAWRRVTG
ncbi:hypothetical protein JJB07_14815 [Tumebacillus sp. ITR2]|uniref:RiboL-PSP-HEPN domain-containing protein n=1 Tax=Tumebacillus amylolyticus TaxID=2801339 RepID=A0ABS1JCA7_9BACL|nr:HEPN domain-containing protein [Tumebacillus amylolyticus]MBL0387910.1 hypothetical protein [Tumebacillus amylolyticus]